MLQKLVKFSYSVSNKMEASKQMKCIVLTGPKKVEVQTRPIPKPQSGQVLIKVMAAPINPSDLAFLLGQYESVKKVPCVPGFQGCGLVVQNGGGFFGWNAKNKKVAFAIDKQQIGTYSQYVIANAMNCVPLDQDTSYEQGSMSLVNPLTVLAFLDKLKSGKHKSVIHTAACSQLGRMLNRVLQKQGIQVINIVRRQQQIDILKDQVHAKYVLNSEDPNFQSELTKLCEMLKTNICFEALGGKIVGKILHCMPQSSTIQVYGGLSQEQIGGIHIKDVVFHKKVVKGFILNQWIQSKGMLSLLPIFMKLKTLIKDDLKSKVSREFPLQKFSEGLQYYLENMTKGKVLIKPWMEQQQFKEQQHQPQKTEKMVNEDNAKEEKEQENK